MMKPHWTALIEDIAELDLVEGYTTAPSRAASGHEFFPLARGMLNLLGDGPTVIRIIVRTVQY
jgi:hypothetical protein